MPEFSVKAACDWETIIIDMYRKISKVFKYIKVKNFDK